MHNKKLGFMCLIVLFAMILVSAQPPFQTSETETGLIIVFPKFVTITYQEDFEVNAHIFNKTNGALLDNTTTDCYFHGYSSNGSHFSISKMQFNKTTEDFNYIIPSSLLGEGQGYYILQCNSSSEGGFASAGFDITESGIEMTTSRSLIQLGLTSLLIMFLFMSLIFLFNVENYIAKFILYWISHLLFVAIFFICWQIGIEHLIQSVAITELFRILFFITIIAIVPMIILSFAWVIYIHAYNEHFQKLIDKGEDPETAFAIANKKKGWIFGN